MTSQEDSLSESQLNEEIEEMEYRLIQYGRCEYCGQAKTNDKWCMTCNAKHFQKLQWKSGSDVIDHFIRDIQARATNRLKVLEWVPYENFAEIKYLAKGGYGKVYQAKWKGGFIHYYNNRTQQWHRSGDIDVVLKCLYGSKNISKEFLDEINLQMRSHYAHGNTIECYGITKDPETQDFMMIMNFMEGGSLRGFLSEKFSSLRWRQKLEILFTAAKGLFDIHEAKLVHKDLHTGNIVLSGLTSFITDFGFCKPADYISSPKEENNQVFGVLPYIAPEILCGKKYSQATDIYSFGIIMNEVASGCPPYHDIPHDSYLALQITQGLRPEINEKITPKLIADLIRRCWDENPENRPDAGKLHDSLWNWYHQSTLKRTHGIRDQIEIIEKSQNFENHLTTTPYGISTSTIYSLNSNDTYRSKLFDITSIVKTVKAPRAESISDTGLVNLVIPDVIE